MRGACDRAVALGYLLIAIGVLWWVIWLCSAGFDLTDEGFYLNSIALYDRFYGTTSQFGFIFHPVYELLQGNVFGLRVFNVLLVYLSAAYLFYVVLTDFDTVDVTPPVSVGLAAMFGLASLAFLNIWLPTPNYNSLNLVALNILGAGYLKLISSQSNSFVPQLLLGVGLALAFMAKPTTFIGVSGIIFVLQQFYYKNVSLSRLLFFVIAVCLILLAGIFLDGSINEFVQRLSDGLRRGGVLNGDKRTLISLVWNSGGYADLLYPLMAIMAVVLAFLLRNFSVFSRVFDKVSKEFVSKRVVIVVVSIVFIAVIFVVSIAGFLNVISGVRRIFHAAPYFLALNVLAISMLSGKILETGRDARVNAAILFLLMPYMYVLGTGNNYLSAMPLVWHFSVIAVLLSLARFKSPGIRMALLCSSLTVPIALVFQLQASAEDPYRQKVSLFQQLEKTATAVRGSVRLLPEQSLAINAFNAEAKQRGFGSETLLIDMTGSSPGILYLMGAKNIVVPWLLGGYSGSGARATMDLASLSSEQLLSAWFLYEAEGRRKIDVSILEQFGLKFPNDYQEVAALQYPYIYTKNIQLFKPK